jgi:hypothetical protein
LHARNHVNVSVNTVDIRRSFTPDSKPSKGR